MINKDLLDILACPECKSAVREEEGFLVCTQESCGLGYPVRDGIPVMLPEEAVTAEARAAGAGAQAQDGSGDT